MGGGAGSKCSRKGDVVGSFISRVPFQKFVKQVVEQYGKKWFKCQKEAKYLDDAFVNESPRLGGTGVKKQVEVLLCGLITRFLWAEGIEEEELDMVVARSPYLICNMVDITHTKALDMSHGPILSAQERQARDDSWMAHMFGMAELKLRIGGCPVTDDEMENLVERYPLMESEPFDDDEAFADEAMDEEDDDDANALTTMMTIDSFLAANYNLQ
ncbi:hypothetical protein H5410_004331 [Solanum commersonii]|uniref:Uncharacterized protein n=1 Tax=Solanum commersonii TaxID=4109 RepID=A0A9J6B7E2_SOLCO|nr:hypothetical protein H5410_004331 [Solanum commersonii]